MVSIRYEDENGDLRRIFLSGRLDTAGSEEISSQLAEVAASAKRRVLVDLSNITFLSSMGIRALIASAKEQQARGGQVVLNVGGNDLVGRTLEATGVDQLIPVFDDLSMRKRRSSTKVPDGRVGNAAARAADDSRRLASNEACVQVARRRDKCQSRSGRGRHPPRSLPG